MKPARTIKSTLASCNASTNARSASSSSFVRNFPGGTNFAGSFRSRACAKMPAPSTSLNTMATSAGIFPAVTASAIATKFEPLPEPRTPSRNGLLTRFEYQSGLLKANASGCGLCPYFACSDRNASRRNRMTSRHCSMNLRFGFGMNRSRGGFGLWTGVRVDFCGSTGLASRSMYVFMVFAFHSFVVWGVSPTTGGSAPLTRCNPRSRWRADTAFTFSASHTV